MKEISITNQINVNNVINTNSEELQPQRMTSLEIAELTGKQHKHVMEAIRKMEPGWAKVCGSNFRLTSRTIIQPNGGTREVPCYSLTQRECLFIAAKFNDETRAKLVIRWEELEKERTKLQSSKLLPEPKKILALADHIIGSALSEMNAAAEDTLTATQVAKTFNMTVWDFNAVLRDLGIQYRRHGQWNLSDDLQGRGLTEVRTHVSYSLKGQRKVKHYMTWTLQGLRFLNSKLGYPNF